MRRFLNQGTVPPAGAVRIEELTNYFRFDYPQPRGNEPFSVTTELAVCPWNARHKLALIGLKGREIPEGDAAPRIAVRTSGSLSAGIIEPETSIRNTRLRMLTDVLTERDRVAIVVYAGASGLVLPSTTGDQKATIHRRLPSFRLAARPMEATVKDSTMETLADKGNGQPWLRLGGCGGRHAASRVEARGQWQLCIGDCPRLEVPRRRRRRYRSEFIKLAELASSVRGLEISMR